MAKNAPKTSKSKTGNGLPKSSKNILEAAVEEVKEEVQEITDDVRHLEQLAAKELKNIKKIVGPGIITGAADDDPSGIATYSIGGAQFGFAVNWLVLFMLPMMVAVQDIAGRIGLVTGKGLAGVIKQNYPRWLLYLAVGLLVFANVINIGADIGAIAAATNLVVGGSMLFWAIFWTTIIGVLMVFVSYIQYAKVLKFLTLSLLAYVATVFVVEINWLEVFKELVTPKIIASKDYLLTLVGFLGTTISPYLFFWQASEEVEEVKQHRFDFLRIKVAVGKQRLDTILGMFFSQLVTFFIIITAAATLHQAGITNLTSAQDAAAALRPLAGNFAFLLFALGIIGTGLLGIPVLAGSAAYAVSEVFNWQEGLSLKLGQAKGFYGVIVISLLLGMLINFAGINPIHALFYAAVVNGIVAAPIIAIMITISANKKIMGDKGNRPITLVVAGITCIAMAGSAAALIWSLIS